MSARYELRAAGVHDNQAGVDIGPLSGKAWAEYHEWLAIAGNVPDPMPAPPPVSLDEAMAQKLSEIEGRAVEQRRKVTGAVSPQEMSSWTLKRDQALAFTPAAGDISAPMLAAEARARGVATADIVARVLKNATDYSMAEAAIAGNSGKHKDAVRLLVTAKEVLAYDASGGWPFMPPVLPRLQMPAQSV